MGPAIGLAWGSNRDGVRVGADLFKNHIDISMTSIEPILDMMCYLSTLPDVKVLVRVIKPFSQIKFD